MTPFTLGTRLVTSLLPLAGLLSLILALAIACSEDPTATPPPAVVVTDSNGNDVVFEKPPERIVAYDSDSVEILFAMGEGHRIVGAHDFVDYPPETADIPRVGDAFNVNAEKILELEPDLIYAFYAGTLAELQNLGIKTLYIESLSSNLDDVMEHFRLWGKITGNVQAAEEEVSKFQARLDGLKEKLADVERGPRVYHHTFEFWAAGGDTLVGDIYALLKADLVTKEVSGYKQVSPEEIVVKDPEVIVAPEDAAQQITDNPAFGDVSAVKNGRIVNPQRGSLSVAGPRLIEAIEELAEFLYPNRFP